MDTEKPEVTTDIKIDSGKTRPIKSRTFPTLTPEGLARARKEAEKGFIEDLTELKRRLPVEWFAQIERTPERYRKMRVRALLGKVSAKQAIKAKCYECVGYENIQEEVGDCRSLGCPVWAHRPIKNDAD